MHIEIQARGAFSSALVRLDAGESFVSESGAMFRASGNVDIDVSTKTRGKGGILAGLKRLVGGDNFFFSTYRTLDGQPGEVGLAPTLQGEVHLLELDGGAGWQCAGGSYLASGPEVEVEPRFQGLRGLVSGEGLFFMECTGHGPLLVNAFGRIIEQEVDGELILDTSHLVAIESGLDYSLSKAGGSWLSSFVAGEGVVMRIHGRGKVLIQSHNPAAMGRSVGRHLPPRQG